MNVHRVLFLTFFIITANEAGYGQLAVIGGNNQNEKLFSFGIIADVQYADADKTGARDYRNSIYKLEKCMEEFNTHDLEFTISLGDLIDRDYASFDKPLSILKRSKAPIYYVIGNHEFSVADQYKEDIHKRLNNKKDYYNFKAGKFDFIMLDGSGVSMFAHEKDSKAYVQALEKYEALKAQGLNNATTWNGGIGDKQMKWLSRKLKKAERTDHKVLLFCHWPLLPENGTQLWDNQKVLDLIESYSCVVAWISGHHHAGGYHKEGNIHHLTIKGMVEAQSKTSCGIMDVYPDKLILNGFGDQPDQVIEFSQ